LPEILHVTIDDTAVHRLGAPQATLDASTMAVLEAKVAEAGAKAYADGEAAGRAAAAASAARTAQAVEAAVARVHAELVAQREQATRLQLDVAATLAEAVLGRVAPDDAQVVLTRVQAAMALLDDPELTLHLHPEDHAVLVEHTIPGVTLQADPSVALGDARITGAYAGAELTRTALLAAVVEALREGEPLDDLIGDATGPQTGAPVDGHNPPTPGGAA
jgi:flagellar biosynthesis/type III secretory pathway protein FliH